MELKEIKELISLMKKNDLSVFKMEKEGFKITLKKGVDFQPAITAVPSIAASAFASAATPSAAVEGTPEASATTALKEVVSPMVGTFYAAPSPESAPFVEPGTEVSADTVVCVIEAMKVMNEIKAEVSGVIAEVLIENGKPVQFGQPLFRVK